MSSSVLTRRWCGSVDNKGCICSQIVLALVPVCPSLLIRAACFEKNCQMCNVLTMCVVENKRQFFAPTFWALVWKLFQLESSNQIMPKHVVYTDFELHYIIST